MEFSVRYSSMSFATELNRRCVPRYAVQAPVTFTWKEGKRDRKGDGWTRDISGSGMYAVSSTLPPVGATMQIQAILPPFGESGRVLRICMKALVIRVIGDGDPEEAKGFAVQSHEVVLKASGDGESEEDLGS
jgi:hypothetical protein